MSIVIRDFASMDDFRKAEDLQHAVWGMDDIIDPGDLMMVIQVEGGLAAGAFDGDRLLGYVFAFPTTTPGVQHSHRLAVLPEARGLGLGAKMKWYQADWCLDRGITRVRWTYDPLRLTNAMLNVMSLGAIVDTYLPDYYGAMPGINAGTASDRLVADWRLDGRRVAARRRKASVLREDAAQGAVRVALPADFAALLDDDLEAAKDHRFRVRRELQDAFAAGLAIVGVDRATAEYLLLPTGEIESASD